jgi:hypothetical protein
MGTTLSFLSGRHARHRLGARSTARALIVAVLMAAAIAVPAAAGPAGAQEASTPYVALGDSFTAGPLIPPQLPDPISCLRSNRNYPHELAGRTGLHLVDVSCSGAQTRHMFNAQGDNPPQLNALDADTGIVTLGIGGNDIGFSSIIENCVTLWPFGSRCQNEYVSGGNDEISNRIAATAPDVAAVLTEIATRAPAADIYVVGYPAILPHSGNGCWPSLPIAWADVAYLRAKTIELNAMLAEQAALHGATYVDMYGPSAGRDACASSGTRWVEPLIPANAAAPVHPNARGMAGIAGVLAGVVTVGV